MGGLGDLINAIISMITTLVEGYTKNAALQAGFTREGQIQNEVINRLQAQYGNLENQLGASILQQKQDELTEETKQKILKGNLISLTIAIVVVVVIVGLFLWIMKSSKK